MVVKLKKVVLENFRIHKNLAIDFDDKVTLILGENGTGKTSILLGIIYALFGSQALTSYEKGGRKENLVRRGSSLGKVTVVLQDNENIYEIIREVPSGNGIIRKNGKVVASGNETITRYVLENLLKVKDLDKAVNVIFIRQRTLGSLVLGSGKKTFSEELEELLDLKKFTEIADTLSKALEDLRKELLRAKSEYTRESASIQKYFGEDIGKLEELAKRREELERQLKELERINIRYKYLKREIDEELLKKEKEINEKYSKIKEELREVENIILELKEESAKYDILTDDFKEFLDKKIEELEETVKKIKVDTSRKSLILNKIKQIERIIKNLKELPNIKEEDIKELEEKLEKKKEELRELNVKIKDIQKLIEILEKVKEPKCPVCGSRIENPKKLLEEKVKELEELKKRDLQIKREILNLEKELEEKREIYNKRKYYLNFALEEFGTDKIEELERIKENFEKELNEILIYEKVYSALSYLKKKEIERSVKELEETKSRLEKELRDLEIQRYRIFKMKEKIKELEELKEIVKRYGIELEEIERKIKEVEDELESLPKIDIKFLKYLKEKKEYVEKLKKYIEELEKFVNIISKLATVFQKIKIRVRDEVAKRLTIYLNYWFKRIYIYDDIESVEIRVERGRKDFVYKIYVKKKIGERDVVLPLEEASLSGGQIVALDLAFRFALINLLSKNIGFLLLDEPTESLDERIRRKLAETLKSLENFQLIICTHDEIFKEAAAKSYYLYRKGTEIEVKVY